MIASKLDYIQGKSCIRRFVLDAPHPMDCTDMVIGAARGGRAWVGDHYTRGRSTPQRDQFYGGTESLTAAGGFEKDGYTYILFRRKLTGRVITICNKRHFYVPFYRNHFQKDMA